MKYTSKNCIGVEFYKPWEQEPYKIMKIINYTGSTSDLLLLKEKEEILNTMTYVLVSLNNGFFKIKQDYEIY